MKKKRVYQIRNWKEYNKSLIARGDVNIWISDEAIHKWLADKSKKIGRPRIYSNDAILCALMVKAVYHLPLRALQGFLVSIFNMCRLNLPVPSYSQICRRSSELGQEIKRLCKGKQVTDIVIDSSGLKVYGEGEWKVRKHGKSKRRTWRKIHLVVCAHTQEIVLSLLTDNKESDGEAMLEMADYFPETVERGYGDGAYDKSPCYQKLHDQGIKGVFPPQKGAILHDLSKEPWMKDRNAAIEMIDECGNDEIARQLWKRLADQHTQSLAETAMYRYKTLFGNRLMSRRLDRQKGETFARSLAMNQMTRLGMPKGVWVSK